MKTVLMNIYLNGRYVTKNECSLAQSGPNESLL